MNEDGSTAINPLTEEDELSTHKEKDNNNDISKVPEPPIPKAIEPSKDT